MVVFMLDPAMGILDIKEIPNIISMDNKRSGNEIFDRHLHALVGCLLTVVVLLSLTQVHYLSLWQ